MKGSIYKIIQNDLKNLALQTALLEACDWDETQLDEFSSHLSVAFNYIASECYNFDEGIVMLKEILEINGWVNGQYDIVVELLKAHAQEIKEFMLLEEQ